MYAVLVNVCATSQFGYTSSFSLYTVDTSDGYYVVIDVCLLLCSLATARSTRSGGV